MLRPCCVVSLKPGRCGGRGARGQTIVHGFIRGFTQLLLCSTQIGRLHPICNSVNYYFIYTYNKNVEHDYFIH